jgi:hypothetical protein
MNNFMNNLVAIITILSSVALPIILGIYIALRSMKTRHIERMELIKQVIVPPKEESTPNKYKILRNGILILGVALGLGVGLLIGWKFGLNEDAMFWSVAPCILLFLGMAYLVYYTIVRKQNLNDE